MSAELEIRNAELPRDVKAIERLWLSYLTWGNEEMQIRHGVHPHSPREAVSARHRSYRKILTSERQDGPWRHYYVDTSSIHVTGDTAAAVEWDVSILASRSMSRFGPPSIETTREEINVACSTYTVSGIGLTSTASLHQYGEAPITIFADTPNVAGPHHSVAQFLCERARGR